MLWYDHSSLSVGADPESGGTSTSGRKAEDLAPSLVWAAVVNFERVGKKDNTDGGDGESHKKRKEGPYIVDVLLNCSSDTIPGTGPKRSAVEKERSNTKPVFKDTKCRSKHTWWITYIKTRFG